MADYLTSLALAVLPILGTYAGAAVAETVTVSRRVTSFALHAAAGVALAVVAVELLPQALGAERPWLMIAAFVAGGVGYVGLDAMTGMLEHRADQGSTDTDRSARQSAPSAGRGVKFALLAFTSGMLATVVVEELAPEADRFADARVAALHFVGGFALFALLSTYVG